MSNVVVYRVERENGDGMYRLANEYSSECPFNDVVDEWIGLSPERRNEYHDAFSKYHALPIEDPAIYDIMLRPDSRFYYFAFATREQLDAWIRVPAWKVGLRIKGFAVSMYSVDKEFAAIGETQAVFRKDRAALVERVDFNAQNELTALTDPKIVFPPAKVKKGIENKTSKFSKKHIFLALKTKLDAIDAGQGRWFIPIGNDRYLSIYRMTMMRIATWGVRGVWVKNGGGYKKEVPASSYIYVTEDEAALGKFEQVVAKLKTEKNPDNWNTILNATLK